MNHNDHPEIMNGVHMLIEQHNDYVWVKFKKCCGYQIIFPFLAKDSIQALYRHIDTLWDFTTVHLIWVESPENHQYNQYGKVVIPRGDRRTIQQFFLDNHVHRPLSEHMYTVYFDIGNHNDYLLSNSHCNSNKNINSNSNKNINSHKNIN
jgi:hypothetical protein